MLVANDLTPQPNVEDTRKIALRSLVEHWFGCHNSVFIYGRTICVNHYLHFCEIVGLLLITSSFCVILDIVSLLVFLAV